MAILHFILGHGESKGQRCFRFGKQDSPVPCINLACLRFWRLASSTHAIPALVGAVCASAQGLATSPLGGREEDGFPARCTLRRPRTYSGDSSLWIGIPEALEHLIEMHSLHLRRRVGRARLPEQPPLQRKKRNTGDPDGKM